MPSKILTTLLIIVFCPLAASAQPKAIELSVRSAMEFTNKVAMEVALVFPGEEDGETIVRLPTDWGGQDKLYLALRDLQCDQAEILGGDDPGIRKLKHAPGASITLRYRVVVDENGPQFNGRGNNYCVQFQQGLLFAIGYTWLIQPESIDGQDEAIVKISFPEGVAWASDMEHTKSGRQLVFRDLVESVLIAGDVRTVEAGGGARLVIRGSIDSRDDAGWKDSFQRIAQAQRGYWKSADEPFLVTILATPPLGPGSISVGGTGLSDSFAFFASSNSEPSRLDQVMAHEMMHTWVPRRIGGMPPRDEQSDYWLSEGFTDWTSWRVLVRSGFWTPEDFVRAFNENLRDYDQSPVREAPNSEIVAGFWRDRATADLPYRRGMLLATYWDSKVRSATAGQRDFDDVLWHMQELAAKNDSNTTAVYLLAQAMQEIAGISIASDIEAFVEKGTAVEFPEDLFGEDCKLIWNERPTFHRGFDIEATMAKGNVISGVVVDGPAYKAGLRDGMLIVERSGGEIGNSQVEIVYKVKDGDKLLTMRWLPAGNTIERFRELRLASDWTPETTAAIASRLGGTDSGKEQR